MKEFSFDPFFGDGMVIQRDKPILICGTSSNSYPVTVTVGKLLACCMPIDGYWECRFPPMNATEDIAIIAEQQQHILELHNVCIGDVWVAAGQSNMEFYLKYEKHWPLAKTSNKNSHIRYYTCPRVAYEGHTLNQANVGCWFDDCNKYLENFSAIGYWFAREVQPQIGVPIGIVSCNWGGTSASAWLPQSALKNKPLDIYLKDYLQAVKNKSFQELYEESMAGWELQLNSDHLADWEHVMRGMSRSEQRRRLIRTAHNPVVPMGPFNKNRPGGLYESMVSQISKFPIKGILWYQGENDVHHAEIYDVLFSKLIKTWRIAWNDELPFLFVQLTSFDHWMALNGEHFPDIRIKQELVSETVSNCWMVCSMDAGMKYDIHPKEKRIIGHRLALLAQNFVYHIPCLSEAPKIRQIDLENGDTLICYFSFCGNGLHGKYSSKSLFRVTQENKTIRIKKIEIGFDYIRLNLESKVSSNVHISFAQAPYANVTLYNSSNIPIRPFIFTYSETVKGADNE